MLATMTEGHWPSACCDVGAVMVSGPMTGKVLYLQRGEGGHILCT